VSWKFWNWKTERQEAIAQAVLEAVSDMESRVSHLERVVLTVNGAPTVDAILQDAADFNRANAHEKFGDVLFSRDGEWYETATGERVLFTPYGWRPVADVNEYIDDAQGKSVAELTAARVQDEIRTYSPDETLDYGDWERHPHS
jgi:phage baseplate assembly protein W